MRVKSYHYLQPNNEGIVEALDRSGYMSPQYINLVHDYVAGIKLEGRCAFLYAAGAVLPASEARNTEDKGIYRERGKQSGACIKELAAYGMHKWIGQLSDRHLISYANINGNTCASGMHSIYEAAKLLTEGFDEVLLVAEEKTSYNTLRIFDEHGIDLKVGEGLAILHLWNGPTGIEISDAKWHYEYNRNPFGVTESGYTAVNSPCDMVNPHGTGTQNNEQAESAIYGDIPQIRYKEQIGHTQGVSGLIEVCMVLDEPIEGDVLCISSGLGGFYGSCIVHKG